MMYYLSVILAVFASACAQMLLKKGAQVHYDSFWRQYLNFWVLSGYAIMFGAMAVNVFAMSRGVMVKEVSIIESLSYLFVPILSFLIFREHLSWQKMLVVALIIVGVIIFFI